MRHLGLLQWTLLLPLVMAGSGLTGALAPLAGTPLEIKKKKTGKKDDGGNPGKKAISPDDARRLDGIRLRLRDWSKSTARISHEGLRLEGSLLPDALVYKTATTYLALREGGLDHAAAIAHLARSLPRWKRYTGRALVLVGMKNEKFELGKKNRRVYTFERNKKLDRDGIWLLDARKRRLPFQLAGKPAGIRVTKLRVKKFWRTRDGLTRRPRQSGEDPPGIGRGEFISKPFHSAVIEDTPVEIELLLNQKLLGKKGSRSCTVQLRHWKRYEGPFDGDILDLNEKRPWKAINELQIVVQLPASGRRVSRQLRELLEEVQRHSANEKRPQ